MREQWLVIVVAVVLGLAGAAATWFLRPAEYTASLTMYVSAQVGDTPNAAYQGAQLSAQRVTSYTELLRSARVSGEVASRLSLVETPDELAKQITTTSKLDSVLIDVAVTDPSPQRAAQIVNAIGEVFPQIVEEIERPTGPGGVAPVIVRVVEPASVPSAPTSTGLPVTLVLGLLAGVAVGVGAALVRNALDTSIKSPEQLREVSGAPNLGIVAFDAGVPKRPLTVHEDPQSPRAEAFRQLRTNLQFVGIDEPPQAIVVTSAVAGEGKTTTLCNLAIALSSADRHVLLIEADLRRPKASDYLGLDRSVGLTNVLAGKAQLGQVLQPWGGGAFDVLASGPLPPNPSELLASQQMRDLLDALRRDYDSILIDAPPLLPVTDAVAVAPLTDGALVVCRFGATTTVQVTATRDALNAVSARLLGTVLTMVPSGGPRAYAQYNDYYTTDLPRELASPNGLSVTQRSRR
ncbi:tyrosine-protein kinase domain-containing protein [Pseudonocardia artemisiae]